jgi:type I restriction-modification system DNA methylase subunit
MKPQQKTLTGGNATPYKRVKKKQEALTVRRYIDDILVRQLSIPSHQIVNDITFVAYTGSKRPDILVSEFEYDPQLKNEAQFIENLVAYAEAKDDCIVGDKDWEDAKQQGFIKAPKLKLPFFIVTNCKHTIFYNFATKQEISLNGNPIREFQTIDILRLIKNRLTKNPLLNNIMTNVDSLSIISEAVFNKKLWELAKVYRNINFENNVQKIDFTIGFISLEYFEERERLKGTKDENKIYWSDCVATKPERLVANLSKYISRLEQETQFAEFAGLMEKVRVSIVGIEKEKPLVNENDVAEIYDIINSMKPLHGCGFDLFGAVYEMFANAKEKKEFGEYFTRRHYAHIFAKLLLKDEQYFSEKRPFTILDPACGTGGFLTEGFKILYNAYQKTDTLSKEAKKFLEQDCFWGIDVRSQNISRTKLNMFLVGDSHTHMYPLNTLTDELATKLGERTWHYIITNPPVGAGTIKAETSAIASYRDEIAFLYRVIKLLEDGGRACILLPDGVLENPSLSKLRKELLEKCNIEAIISLPKFAFAPYTKEKMYAVFFTKKGKTITKIQNEPIWMYIIDNDGLANSDKRFPTKLRNNRNGWLHDEISGWVSTEGDEMVGKLEDAWLKYDDASIGGAKWINEKGETVKLRKGGFIHQSEIQKPEFENPETKELESRYCLLPEYYLRPYEPKFVTPKELTSEIESINQEIERINHEVS